MWPKRGEIRHSPSPPWGNPRAAAYRWLLFRWRGSEAAGGLHRNKWVWIWPRGTAAAKLPETWPNSQMLEECKSEIIPTQEFWTDRYLRYGRLHNWGEKRWKRKKVENKRKLGRWQGISLGRCAPDKNPPPQGSKHLMIIITLTTLKSLMLHRDMRFSKWRQ